MGLVSELLAHGGFLPQLAELHKKRSVFNKKNGIVFGIFWMITLMMLLPAMIGVLNGPGELQGLFAVLGVFGGMMIIIGSLVMLPSSRQYPLIPVQNLNPPVPSAHGLHSAGQRQALPGQQSIPASAYAPPRAGSWRDTNDLEPSSVTESTTKLLEKEDKIQ
jgi:hypothetical protein